MSENDFTKGTITYISVPPESVKWAKMTLDNGEDYITKDETLKNFMKGLSTGAMVCLYSQKVEKKDKSGSFNAIKEFAASSEEKPKVLAKQGGKDLSTIRSINLSYAVNLCIGGKIEKTEIRGWAEKFTAFVNGEEE